MKKQFKTKLRLNSQCIRVLHGSGLDAVHGGALANDNTDRCPTGACTDGCTVNCTVGCRACG